MIRLQRNRMSRGHSSGGFTLVELLVVVAIIGLLASVVLTSLGLVRVKARDTRRSSDLKNFQTALELYATSNYHYPYTNCSGSNSWTSFDSPSYSPNLVCDAIGGSGQTLTNFMAPYIGKLLDPNTLGGDSGYLYINQGGANDYCILFWRTPENLNNFPSSLVPAGRCAAWNSAGQCTSGTNAIYKGSGSYAAGC